MTGTVIPVMIIALNVHTLSDRPTNRRHRPEQTVLYSIIAKHYPRFVQETVLQQTALQIVFELLAYEAWQVTV